MAALQRNGVMAVLVPCLLPPPAPFKIFVLLAGVAGISATRFATAIAIGRGIRYLALGILAVRYGERAMAYMREQRHRGLARASSACSRSGFAAYLLWSKARGGQAPINRLSWPPWSSPSSSRSGTRRRRCVELHRELTETLTAWGRSYEIIVVDDGSTDDSFEILARLQAADPRLRVIRFRRNFGQTAAFAAGFAHARGRLIVTSDGDLQNDPRDIPAMVEQLEGGYDIVCGWRKDRKDALRLAAAAVDDGQRADLGRHRRAPARLRLLAEGLPRRDREAT